MTSFDQATAGIRALIPGNGRYARVLAGHLDPAVRRVRGLEVRWGGFAGVGGEARSLRDVGTIVDRAYAEARTPPAFTETSTWRSIEATGLPAQVRPGDVLTATIGVSWPTLVRVDVELIDPTGAFRGLQVHRPEPPVGTTTTFPLSLPVPADTTLGAHRLLVSLLWHDGSVRTRSFLLDVTAPTSAAASPPAIGLLGAVERVSDSSARIDVSNLAASYMRRERVSAQVTLMSRRQPGHGIVGWEARIEDTDGGTHALEAERCEGYEVELTTTLRAPTRPGAYRLVVVMKLANGTSRTAERALTVSGFIPSPAGSP